MDLYLITSMLLLFYVGTTSVHSTYTNEFVAHIEGGIDIADGLAERYGFINGGEIENFPDHYAFHHQATQKRSIQPSTGDHTAIKHEAAVIWIEQQVIRKRVKRDVDWINDPKYRLQWYMNRKNAPNMNVEAAWNMGYTGKGVVVSILDDGIDYTHPDLAKNYDPLASRDINSNDDDPMPWENYDQTNRHGTRCAGEVAMEAGNGICGVGVAYNASIGGVRMLDDEVTDSVEGRSLATHRDHIDIYSASWGPEDNGMTVDGPGRLAKQAFKDGIDKGRAGKGSIFVWASGNGGHSKDNCGCDGYTNSIYTISVSSTSENGEAPWYLEECASTLATTYSSGSPREKKVTTTDLGGRCTDDHTGTSASAPFAAGLCALALQANPNMTWRDMQYIIVMTSRSTSMQDSNWFTNGAGYSVSHRYGFGLMDAGAMVQLAQNWINLPEQRTCVIPLASYAREISGYGMLASFTLNTTACENGPNYLEHVQSSIDVTFGNRGALVLTLVSPSGTHSRLLDRRPKDKRRGSFSSWPFMSTHFWGERPQGVWTLHVENGLPKSNSGHFRSWVLTLYGTESLPSRATTSKQPKTPPDIAIPVEETRDEVDHSKAALPRSSEYYGLCHRECFNGCVGPLASDCYKCLHYRDRNTDECVEHCPEGFYDLPEMHTKCRSCSILCLSCAGPKESDCLSCNDGFFLMDGSCFQECNSGYFADTRTKTCIQCAPLCSVCVDSPTNCVECKQHAVLTQEHICHDSCSINEYLNGRTCSPCSSSCYTCSSSGEDDCLSCLPGDVLKDRRCVAEWTCTTGYYVWEGSGSNTRECIKCHVTCKNCVGPSSEECSECNGSYILNDGACVPHCLDGYYNDKNGNCLTCSVGCDQCTVDDNCVKCSSELVLVDGECIQSCGDGRYEHEGHCLDCHELCATCIGGGPYDCTECKPDSSTGQNENRYLYNGACVPFCPEGLYEDEESLQCEECDETCATCNGSEINNCISCYNGFGFADGFCNEKEGTHCNVTCKECVDGSDNRCSSCDDDKYLFREKCVSKANCPVEMGNYVDEDNNECSRCNPSCKTCRGASSQDCDTCENDKFLYDNSTCDSHCPYTFYADNTDSTCKECHSTCQSCSGPGDGECQTCQGELFWEDNTCVDTCLDGKYPDWEMHQCMRCFPTCSTCDGPFSSSCLTCVASLTLDHGSCTSSSECSSWTYTDANGACKNCHDTCLTCTGPNAGDCTTCDYDRFLLEENDDKRCEEECLSGYYPDYESNMCRPCHTSCLTCVQGGAQDCMDCSDGMFILSKEDGVYCVDRCTEGFYELDEGSPTDISKTCQMCSLQCLDCDDSYSHCITCRDNTFLYREQCVPNCPRGFVEDIGSNRCIAEDCPLNCRDCNEWGECQTCHKGFQRFYGQCLRALCDEGKYEVLGPSGVKQCQNCTQNCTQCLGPRFDECLACDNSFHISNGQCIHTCRSKQFATEDGECLACHPSCKTCEGPSPYDCMSCPVDTFQTNTGECSVRCPDGTFLNANQCDTCSGNCSSCGGPGPNSCLSCPHTFYLTGDQRCVQTCLDGTYHDHDEAECRPCHSSCSSCDGPLQTQCTSCHDEMYLLENACVAHCGTGFYSGPNYICQPCHSDCKSCRNAEQTGCISCANGKKLLGTQCKDECPSDYYLTFDFGARCEPCHRRCKTCSDMGPFNCMSCIDGYQLEYNVCYSRCDLGSYFVNNTGQHACQPCDPTCLECDGPTASNCISCNDHQSLAKEDDDHHFTCLSCCKADQKPNQDNCCHCDDTDQCVSGPGNPNVGGPVVNPVVRPSVNKGAIVFICFLILAVFGLFFGVLQARSRKRLCWKNSYDQLPTFYNNSGEEPQITLRQNIMPSSDEDDYFDDDDSEVDS